MTEMPPQIFDMEQLARNRNRAAENFEAFAFLKQAAVERLEDKLMLVRRSFSDVLDVGCHSGQVAQMLRASGKLTSSHSLLQTDISPRFCDIAGRRAPAMVSPAETLPVEPASYDAVVSALFLHWVNDVPGLLTQMRLALRPDGLLLVCLFGGRTLNELRQCLAEAETEVSGGMSGRCAPMADIRDIGGLLQRAGLALPVADADLITVTYPNMFRLMADLKGMGEQNALFGKEQHMARRDIFLRAAELYQERFSTADGQINASFELITLTGWAPHASQQKPLARGSATHSLLEAFEIEQNDPQKPDQESD